MKEVKDEYQEYVEKKYDRDDEVNQEASIDLEKVGQLKSNPVSNDEKLKQIGYRDDVDKKLKEIMKFSKDFGLDATTKVLEVLNQYKDEEIPYPFSVKDEEKPADITPLERLKILMRSSIGAIQEANERRLSFGYLASKNNIENSENQLKTQISVALQDLEEFTEDSRLDYEQTTF